MSRHIRKNEESVVEVKSKVSESHKCCIRLRLTACICKHCCLRSPPRERARNWKVFNPAHQCWGLCTNPSIERNADGAVCVRLRGARRARLAGIIMTAGLCPVRAMRYALLVQSEGYTDRRTCAIRRLGPVDQLCMWHTNNDKPNPAVQEESDANDTSERH